VVPGRSVVDLGEGKPVVVLVAYPAKHEELSGWLNEVAGKLSDRKTLLLGHFQVAGSRLSNGQLAAGVSPEVVSEFTLALLGHVHKPQQVRQGCFYVGSPFQQNFGEAGEEKRVALLDLETLQLDWLKLPSRYPVYKKVSAAEFEKLADNLWEDRFEVTLTSADEAERFYAHPKSGQVQTSLLHFASTTAAPANSPLSDLSTDNLLRMYAKEHGLQGFTEDELVEAGAALCR
jgi:DNA repair exonuclease SbcCD nuclease subunit